MRRFSVLAWLLALLAASPAEARCRVVLEDGGVRLGRTANGWELCGRGVSFGRAGRPVALDTRGNAVAVRLRSGERTIVHWAKLAGERWDGRTVLGPGERFVRQAFARDGLYVAVGGARPHIRRTEGEPAGVVDRTRGIALRSLRRRGGAVEWRIGRELRRVSAIHGGDIPPKACRVPRFALNVSRAGRAVSYELRLGDVIHEGFVFACLESGRPHKIGVTSDDLAIEAVRPLLLQEPFGVFETLSGWKEWTRELVAVDLRSGKTTARGELTGYVVRSWVSPTGAIAVSQHLDDRQEVLTLRGAAVRTLDSGPAVDGQSLALEGTTLSWTSGGERRTAELP